MIDTATAIKILSSYTNSGFGDPLHGGEVMVTDIIDLLKQQEDRIRFLTRAIEQMPKPTKLLDVFGNNYEKIVKCKHCVYGEGLPDGLYQCHYCKDYARHQQKHSPSWFCADGERRKQNELER